MDVDTSDAFAGVWNVFPFSTELFKQMDGMLAGIGRLQIKAAWCLMCRTCFDGRQMDCPSASQGDYSVDEMGHKKCTERGDLNML